MLFYGTYFLLASLLDRGIEGVFEQMGVRKRVTDFRKGKQLGTKDHIVTLSKPKKCPDWMSEEDYTGFPESLSIRELSVGGKILITTLLPPQKTSKPVLKGLYKRRWEIETLFQCLKGRGFHLEETRLTHYCRIKKVMALLALAFCWAHKAGEWKNGQQPLLTKKHGRPEQSLFRYGLDYLTDSLIQGVQETFITLRLLSLFVFPPDKATSYSGGRKYKWE